MHCPRAWKGEELENGETGRPVGTHLFMTCDPSDILFLRPLGHDQRMLYPHVQRPSDFPSPRLVREQTSEGFLDDAVDCIFDRKDGVRCVGVIYLLD